MKNIANMNALNDMAAEMIAGGRGDEPWGILSILDPGTPAAMNLKKAAGDNQPPLYPPLGR